MICLQLPNPSQTSFTSFLALLALALDNVCLSVLDQTIPSVGNSLSQSLVLCEAKAGSEALRLEEC